jgi:putative DNA primase/helicase
VQNGTVDLRTGELRPHRREDLLTKLAPVTFEPAAKPVLWLAFLNRIMGGNEGMIRYLQQIAGLSLTGDASVQELFVMYGCGANGKSVFLDTLSALMGDYAAEAPPSLVTSRTNDEHPTELADLCGKRLVVASETEEGAKLRIQLVKRLTGNARIKGRFMRQDYFEFPRTHKLVLVTNNKPVIRETTNAVHPRVGSAGMPRLAAQRHADAGRGDGRDGGISGGAGPATRVHRRPLRHGPRHLRDQGR